VQVERGSANNLYSNEPMPVEKGTAGKRDSLENEKESRSLTYGGGPNDTERARSEHGARGQLEVALCHVEEKERHQDDVSGGANAVLNLWAERDAPCVSALSQGCPVLAQSGGHIVRDVTNR
jgi:hypothetical protein